MRTIALAVVMLAAVGCYKAPREVILPAVPIDHPENAKPCNDVYYHVVALKVIELGVPVNEDGTYDDAGAKMLAYRVDQQFRRQGSATWFFNQCMKFNAAQLKCMQEAASIPLLNVCQSLFAD